MLREKVQVERQSKKVEMDELGSFSMAGWFQNNLFAVLSSWTTCLCG